MSAAKGILHSSYGTYPVTMYDVDNKKPVAIFRSALYASRYVFNKPYSLITTKSILAQRKYGPKKTGYGVIVTFRSATPEQKVQLGNEESYIIDGSYLNPIVSKKEKRKKERGNSEYIVKQMGNSIKRDTSKLIIGMMQDGYNYIEIQKALNIGQSTINGVSRKKVMSINTNMSTLSVEKLKEMKVIIDNRIKLLENE